MCGIVGIVGHSPVAPLIVDALKRLEYRGYDSAGVATIEHGELARRRAEGKLINLDRLIRAEPLDGTIGIGHTRWATHGVPNETNAHPHFSNGVAIVHNGIIENFAELRAELIKDGYEFSSQTDTEVVAHLVARELKRGFEPVKAAHNALKRLEGAFALAIMFKGDEDLIIGARNGPPLAVGYGEGEMFLGSDAIALAPFTNSITYLEDGDWAVVRRNRLQIYDMKGEPVERKRQQSIGTSFLVDKGNHRHFMEKEIHEQPEVISHTLAHYLDFANGTSKQLDMPFDFAKIDRLAISACGTAYLAGLIGKYWFERHARLPVDIDIASEFRYREMPLSKSSAALFVSQSGETADTLAAVRMAREQGARTLGITNMMGTQITRDVESVLYTRAGLEMGVAATKTFTAQVALLTLVALHLAEARGTMPTERINTLLDELHGLPVRIGEFLDAYYQADGEHPIDEVAARHCQKPFFLYLGRNIGLPVCLEGALKLKEISYIPTEAYSAGEMKHGPIALLDETTPVVAIATDSHVYDKMVSNIQETRARGAQVIAIATDGNEDIQHHADDVIYVPRTDPLLQPALATIPLQLLAYRIARLRGLNVDQPRNLAKTVTVE